jgi:hypothetical protein
LDPGSYENPAAVTPSTVKVTEPVVLRISRRVIEHFPDPSVTQVPEPVIPLLQLPLTVAPATGEPFWSTTVISTVASHRFEPFGALLPSRSATWTRLPPPGVAEGGAGVSVARSRGVAVGVSVADGLEVGGTVEVADGLGVAVLVKVGVGVAEADGSGVGVFVGVAVIVSKAVGVKLTTGVIDGVAVPPLVIEAQVSPDKRVP